MSPTMPETARRKCPSCQEPFNGKPNCSKCGAELALIMQAIHESWRLRHEAWAAFEDDDWATAAEHAHASRRYDDTRAARRMEVLARLLDLSDALPEPAAEIPVAEVDPAPAREPAPPEVSRAAPGPGPVPEGPAKASPPPRRRAARRRPEKRGFLARLVGMFRRRRPAEEPVAPEAPVPAPAKRPSKLLESTARDVVRAVTDSRLNEGLNTRAGDHLWGHVNPSEAAMEILEEAIEPLVDRLQQSLDVERYAESREIAKGLLVGLYAVRHETGEGCLSRAPEFPLHAARRVLRRVSRVGERARKKKLVIVPASFIVQRLPEWASSLRERELGA